MRKSWNGSIHLTGSAIQRTSTAGQRTWKQAAGVTTLALAAILFAIAPMCRAQADAPTNDAVPAVQAPSQTGDQAGDQAASSAKENARPDKVRVVRLSDVEGTVQILRGDQTEFSHAVMNMPLSQGSRINTGADGRAEIEFEDGSVARITPNSSLNISQLETSGDGTLETTVEQLSGLIYYELRSDPKTPFKVMVGDRSVTPTVNSTFRINFGAGSPDLAVIDGKVQVQGASDSYLAEVPQGKTIQFQPSGNAQYTVADGITPNGFDEWNDQRDQEAAKQAQNQTPARVQQGGGSMMDSGFGWSDLDNAGGWYPLPGYGMVWQPYGAGPGFDPYGDGMWADFGGGFGYSWVSGYPWGWLPFHYGMWSYIGGFGWGWLPCQYGFAGGFGYGYGGYGYGGRRHYPRTNVYGGPAGYHAPVPPAIVKGQPAQRIVPVGNPAGAGTHVAVLNTQHGNAGRLNTANGNIAPRSIKFNGTKIAPLHSMTAGIPVSARNAALYNNYPAHAFQGDIRTAMLNRGAGPGAVDRGSPMNRGSLINRGSSINHEALAGRGSALSGAGLHGSTQTGSPHSGFRGSAGTVRGPMNATNGGRFNVARGEPFAGHSFGAQNRAAFGQHTSFGSHGSFGGTHAGYAGGGGGFRGGGGGFRSGGGGQYHGGGSVGHAGGGASMGGFHGSSGGGGGGMSHGGAAGGGGFQGGGGHSH